MGLPTQPIPNSATKPAPYGMLKVSLILMTIAFAWGVMVITSATQLGADWLKKIGGLVLLAMIGTGYWVKRTWSAIIRIETEPTFRRKHRSFVLKAIIAVCVVLLLAAEEGIRVGTHVRHLKKIDILAEQIESLGPKIAPTKQQFVQLAWQATPTMAEYIQRCGKLEPVLNDYESKLLDGDRMLSQALEEIQQVKAYRGWAAMIPTLTVMQGINRKDLELVRAFRKEVDYGKQLAALTPDDQIRFYKANILPVKSDEKRIGNEEIKILKDAKARGINLGELYREVGVQ